MSIPVHTLFAQTLERHQQGDLAGAVDGYQQVLGLVPNHLAAITNLAMALHVLRRHGEAEVVMRRALAVNPDHVDALNGLGIILGAQGRLPEAIVAYSACVARDPGHYLAWHNMGLALSRMDEMEQAVVAFGRSLAILPKQAEVLTQFIFHKLQICDWNDLDQAIGSLRQMIARDAGEINPFLMFFICHSPEEFLRASRNFSRRVVATLPPVLSNNNPPHRVVVSGERLRIGYLSADFHPHATMILAAQLLESHDRSRFEVFGYSYGPEDHSPVRERLVRGIEHFHDLRLATDLAIAQRIQEDGIHILIDLKGYTRDGRPHIVAMRPAPVQINFLGFPGTMGASFIDYIVVDAVVAPPGTEHHFQEQPIRMPHCYQVNDGLRSMQSHTISRHDAGLPAQGVVYCCFNQSVKITPDIFSIWLRLLLRVPGSVLWLLAFHHYAMGRLRAMAVTAGVDPRRLIFATRLPIDTHLSRYQLADLFLDTLPCGAHTTAADALWAGCPVLTMTGNTMAGRVAASLLTGLGLTELVAHSHDEYAGIAVDMGLHREKREALRQRVAQAVATSPVFDGRIFAKNLEKGLSMAWSRHQQGLPPAPITIE